MRFELQRTRLLSYLRWVYLLGTVGLSSLIIAPLLIPVLVSEEKGVRLLLSGIALLLAAAILAFLRQWYLTRVVAALDY